MGSISIASLRLGKTSVEAIKELNRISPGITVPFEITVKCTQVPNEFNKGAYVLIWLGSDNSKGIPTEWKQGYKAFGQAKHIVRGEQFSDESTTVIEVLYGFVNAVNRLDFLKYAPEAYYDCSSLPIIGIDDHSNQTIRMLQGSGERSSIEAMFYALNVIDKSFRSSMVQIDQDLDGFFSYRPRSLKSSVTTFTHTVSNQTIFFGTPGSGKSHKVGKIVEGHDKFTFRTTFHPDSDYATFVGAYKPVKDGKDLTYEFVPQTFTDAYVKAWNFPEEEIYLVIEEINRGNCAQIFGDLFQLLDRDKHNVSEYPINADKDLRKYLETEGILGEGHEGIKDGKLRLPANFHILATMNTSDQSLFPMDSAFKRRWSWEYVPIDLDNEKSQFIITIGDKKYPWASFLKEVNERIHKLSDSEDKQMGNFFIKSDIDVGEFKSKVMFYLWSEVCKDYEKSGSFFKDANNEDAEFTFNSLFPTNDATNTRLQGFMKYLGVEEKQPDAAATGTTKVESGETPQS
jgi:hypothetical protein